MKRFHGGTSGGGFSALLRKMSNMHHGIQMPVNTKQAGASPELGGSTQRRPNDQATIRHMDAKDKGPRQPGGARISHGMRKAQKLGDSAGHRIARGSPGTDGRQIHHPTVIERTAHTVPKPHLIGARRSTFAKTKAGMFKESTGMSNTLAHHLHGVPGHESVINRGIKPRGGYKHRRMPSRARVSNLAHKISFKQEVH